MRVNKVFALFAVVLMLACPLMIFCSETDNNTAAVVRDPNATHLVLKDLDKDDLIKLFGLDEKDSNNAETNEEGKSINRVGCIVAGALMPGLNILGVKDFNLDKFKAEGVDIEFDYIRTVNYGESAKVQAAIQIDADLLSVTFDETYEDVFMLASDAAADSYIPEDYWVSQAAEIADNEEADKQKLKREDPDHSTEPSQLYERTYLELKSKGKVPSGDPWEDKNIRSYAAYVGETEAKEPYEESIHALALLQQLIATGNYGMGIRETYALNDRFTGESLTASGSVHVKLYLETTVVTKEVEAKGWEEGIQLAESYVITESGLTPGMLTSLFGSEKSRTEKINLLDYMPISELDVQFEGKMNISHSDANFTYGSKASLKMNFDIGIKYDNNNAVLSRTIDIEGGHQYEESTFLIEAKEIKFKFDFESTFESKSGKYSKDASFDLSDALKDTVDKMFGHISPEEKRSCEISSISGGKVMFEGWFGFVINARTSGSHINYSWFDSFEIKFVTILQTVHNMFTADENKESFDDMTDEEAKRLILSFPGSEATYEISDAENGINHIRNSFGKESTDNSALIVGVLLAVIIIFAIVALALIIAKSRY